MLDEVSDDAREHGQDKERDLLYKEGTNRRPVIYGLHRGLYVRCCTLSLLLIFEKGFPDLPRWSLLREALKGPIVEKEQDKREGDEHRFRHQA
jgi:hypothetical protein